MKVPSYDDLTPPIPDAGIRDTLAQMRRLCFAADTSHAVKKRARSDPSTGSGSSRASSRGEERGARSEYGALFACIRSTRAPQVIVAIAQDFSPRLERHGASCVVCDVAGLERLLGDAHAIGAEIERAAIVRGGNIRVAVAPTQTAAMLLAIARPGLVVATGDPAAAVATLPLSTLREWGEPGVSRFRVQGSGAGVHVDTFERWGLHTLGDVAALPAVDLSQRMGQAGVWLHRVARGLDVRPLVPDPDVPRFTGSLELEWPIDALEPLSFVLARLLDPLEVALERADRAAAAMRLDLRLVDRTSHARMLLLPAAMRDAKVLRTLLLLDLESHPPVAAIDVVSVELDPAPSRIMQYSLLDRAVPTPEAIATLTARLNALVGETRCGSPALLDTHRPDRFEMRGFAVSNAQAASRDPSTSSGSSRALSRSDGRGADPESRVPNPDLRAQASHQLPLRRFRPPVAIRVHVAHGRPVHVHIDRRGMPGGAVEQSAGPWRTSGGWWSAETMHWDRDEWDVAITDGSVCRLFRDRVTGTWFLEGVLD